MNGVSSMTEDMGYRLTEAMPLRALPVFSKLADTRDAFKFLPQHRFGNFFGNQYRPRERGTPNGKTFGTQRFDRSFDPSTSLRACDRLRAIFFGTSI